MFAFWANRRSSQELRMKARPGEQNGVSFSLGMIRCANAEPWALYLRRIEGNIIVHSGAIVIVQHATQASASLDWSRGPNMLRLWKDQPIPQLLVIALGVIVDEVINGCPQRLLAKQDHALQTRFFNGSHESLGMSIQIRRSWR